MNALILLLAQGFGVGRLPKAPGTYGSLLGLIWLAVLLYPRNLWIYLVGALAGAAVSVWVCGAAEKILGQTDPGSVVLDEIVAVPFCFVFYLSLHCQRWGAMPAVSEFFAKRGWLAIVVIFGLFRLFDVLKPWPVRQSQAWLGGWGVTGDDLLAAVYTNLVAAILFYLFGRAQ